MAHPAALSAYVHYEAWLSYYISSKWWPLAGLTVYLHCVRCHEVYPVFMHCMSAKLWLIQLLCLHVYTMLHINYISANLWATSWSKSIHTLCKNSGSASCNDLFHPCKLWPIQPLCQHSYTMNHIHYIFAKLWPTGPTAYTHYIRTQELHPLLSCCISAKCGQSSHSHSIHTL